MGVEVQLAELLCPPEEALQARAVPQLTAMCVQRHQRVVQVQDESQLRLYCELEIIDTKGKGTSMYIRDAVSICPMVDTRREHQWASYNIVCIALYSYIVPIGDQILSFSQAMFEQFYLVCLFHRELSGLEADPARCSTPPTAAKLSRVVDETLAFSPF